MSNFFNYDQLCQLHIELTNACNAACPMCARHHLNSPLIRPDLVIEQITIDKFKKYFPSEIIEKMEIILFCGVHGDPGMAKDLYEICEYIASANPKTAVRLNTNGGMRDPNFWHKMGTLFAAQRQDHWRWEITWSIDGLEDTNHLYRRNVNWKKVIENAQAFIDAGGYANWDYLIFKHNEHQIDEAKALAKQMGFAQFYPKKSLGVDDGTKLIRMPAVSREGKLEYWIDAPEKAENRNLEKPIDFVPIERYWSFNPESYKYQKENKKTVDPNYWSRVDNAYEVLAKEDNQNLDSANIKCKAETMSGGREIFVDNHGRVIPCCYIGTHLNGVHGDSQSLQLHHEMKKYGWENFDLNKYTLKEILDAGHLNRVFADSWSKPSCKEGKMAYCANICGTYSRVDKIYTHEKMEDKSRNWRQVESPSEKLE